MFHFCLGVIFLGSTLLIQAHETGSCHEHEDSQDWNCSTHPERCLLVNGRLEKPVSPSDRSFKNPTNTNLGTGGSSPTNSASDSCEGSGFINYEDSYRQVVDGPPQCRHVLQAPYYPTQFQDYGECINPMLIRSSLEAVAIQEENQWAEACETWNASRSEESKSKVYDMLARAALAATAAGICGKMVAPLDPKASFVAATFCGIVVYDSPVVVDEIYS